ncbi:MAG TPA: glycosyltransferase, partial [Albitalea sp.]|nr:glycosyltransferase [Albitalea sp.]
MRILQIAYYYPPMGGAGVQRALKFSKYLPEFGVQPVVLAALDPHYVHDASLAAEVPAGLAVHRVEDTPLLARLAARRRTSASGGAAAAPSRWRTVLRDTVLATWHALQYPDDKARWARRALREARAILRDQSSRGEPIELIFTSSPPASAHWIGERLSREFGLPWVADFRDLWTDNPAYAAPAWRRALDRRLEQRWFDRASGVVTVTESWQRLLAARRGAEAPVVFIPNGYAEADFQGLSLPAR